MQDNQSESSSSPEIPKPGCKLLPFAPRKQTESVQGGLMVESLIASNLQLTAALKRLCDVLSDVLEGQDVTDSRGLVAELRSTLDQAASLDESIEQNTFQF